MVIVGSVLGGEVERGEEEKWGGGGGGELKTNEKHSVWVLE